MKYLISSNSSDIGVGNMYVVVLPDVWDKCRTSDGYCVVDVNGREHEYLSYLNMDELNEIVDKHHD